MLAGIKSRAALKSTIGNTITYNQPIITKTHFTFQSDNEKSNIENDEVDDNQEFQENAPMKPTKESLQSVLSIDSQSSSFYPGFHGRKLLYSSLLKTKNAKEVTTKKLPSYDKMMTKAELNHLKIINQKIQKKQEKLANKNSSEKVHMLDTFMSEKILLC